MSENAYRNGRAANSINDVDSEMVSIKTEMVTIYDLGYRPCSVAIVSGFMFFIYMFVNLDHGALPSATVALKDDLGIDNV